MSKVTTLGIDLAKNVFQLHGVDGKGKQVLSARLSRSALLNYLANLPACTIIIEACSGAHYWSRQFMALGHAVKLISPQYVKPYVKHNKNDKNDSAAIVEAGTRPHMHFVPAKSIEQQDIQCLHRIRSRLVGERTALVNQIRGLLCEYGLVVAQNINKLRQALPLILEDTSNELTSVGREVFADLYHQLHMMDEKIKAYEARLECVFKRSEACQRIAAIPGIGLLTATALVSSVGEVKVFKNSRHFAAFLGLVPRQHSSGNKQRLLGISKRGNTYLRTLLIHGARAALRVAHRKSDKRSLWAVDLKKRAGENKTCVALANKNARTVWALLARQKSYQPIAA